MEIVRLESNKGESEFDGDFQIVIEQPREPDVANQCVDSVDLPQSFLSLLFEDDFHFDYASSSVYDQDRSEAVSVDAELTGNAKDDEVEVEVRTILLFLTCQ